MIYFVKRTRSKISKRKKAHGAKSGENQAQASESPLPTKSHRMCIIFPSVNCGMCEVLSTRKAHLSLGVQSLYWLSHAVTFCLCAVLSFVRLFATPRSSTPDSSVHVISQTKILEWVAISSSQWIFLTQGSNPVSCIGGWILYHLATRGSLTC